MAITETVDKAKRPSWQYMKSILELWLASGSAFEAKNGTDPKKPIITETVKVDYGDGRSER